MIQKFYWNRRPINYNLLLIFMSLYKLKAIQILMPIMTEWLEFQINGDICEKPDEIWSDFPSHPSIHFWRYLLFERNYKSQWVLSSDGCQRGLSQAEAVWQSFDGLWIQVKIKERFRDIRRK